MLLKENHKHRLNAYNSIDVWYVMLIHCISVNLALKVKIHYFVSSLN